MAIRYDKKLNQELNRIVKNFNQKIVRLEKQEREMLPTTTTVRQIKKDISNRQDLTRKLKELQMFSKRGAEDIIITSGGYKTTEYEINKLKKERARAKRSLTKEIKTLEKTHPTIFGKPTYSTYAQMGSSRYLNIKKKREALNKNVKKLTKEEFERHKKLIEKINVGYENTDTFKQSYLDMLTDLGYYYDYDPDKIDELKEKIKQLNPNNFTKLFNTEKSIKAITDYYPDIKRRKTQESYEDTKKDVHQLYDNLIKNIDDILKDYV